MLDWRALPLRLAATLAAGLPEESRSNRRLSGQKVSFEATLQAASVDVLRCIEWRLAGCPHGMLPQSVLASLNGNAEEHGDVQSFDSAAEFEAALAAVKGG